MHLHRAEEKQIPVEILGCGNAGDPSFCASPQWSLNVPTQLDPSSGENTVLVALSR